MIQFSRNNVCTLVMCLVSLALVLSASGGIVGAKNPVTETVTVTGYTIEDEPFVFSRNSNTGYCVVAITQPDFSEKYYYGFDDLSYFVSPQATLTVTNCGATTLTVTVTNPDTGATSTTTPPPQVPVITLEEVP